MKTILRWTLLLTGVCIFPAAAGNQILLRNLDPADGLPQLLAADADGHLFVVSALTDRSGQFATRVVKLDLNGSRLASLDIPNDGFFAAAADSQGNLVLAGLDEPSQQGIILKLDAQLHNTLFSRLLQGIIQAAAVDASGNIYVTGLTSSANFPVTPGAYQTKAPIRDFQGSAAYYAFLTEVSAGNQLLYSTYFGGDATYCVGGGSCVGVHGFTRGTAIALDPSGAAVIAGTTDALDLPTTAGVLAPTCLCTNKIQAGFIAKFQPNASQQLQWSTFLNAGVRDGSTVDVYSLALDTAGNVILGGSAPVGLPTTAGTIQPSVPDSGGFVVKLNRAGAAVIWGTYFGTGYSRVNALRMDTQGRVLFTGIKVDPSLPRLIGGSPAAPPYLARLSSDGATLVDFNEGPVGGDLAIASTGRFVALGQALWIETANPGPSLLSVTNSANGQYSTVLGPVELITLYGVGLGPQTPVNGLVQNGAFTSSLAGCQVLFDGVAAPLIYADSGQIKTVVPHGVGYFSTQVQFFTHIQIATPAGTIDGPAVAVNFGLSPGIFQDSKTGLAAALNQDGSINSPSNPAKAGSIVAVFATGAGAATYSLPDGALVPMGIYNWPGPVWALTDKRSLEVSFVGDAPGLVAGVIQINFRVPDSLPPGNTLTFSLSFSGVSTGQSQVAVAP